MKFRFPLLLAIVFGRHLPPGQLAAIVGRQHAIHAARLAAYEQTASALPPRAREVEPFRLATLDFGLAYERAVLDWFDGLPEAIRSREPWPESRQNDAPGGEE